MSKESFLNLGLGELDLAVLLGLADRIAGDQLTVLLRAQSLASPTPEKQDELRKLRALGVHVATAD